MSKRGPGDLSPHGEFQAQLIAWAKGEPYPGKLRCPDMTKPSKGSQNIQLGDCVSAIVNEMEGVSPYVLRHLLAGKWGGVPTHDAGSEIYGSWIQATLLAAYQYLPKNHPLMPELRRCLRAWYAFHALGAVDAVPSKLAILGPEGYRDERLLRPIHGGFWVSAPAARSAVKDGGNGSSQIEIDPTHRILSWALRGRCLSKRQPKMDFPMELIQALGILDFANDSERWGLDAEDRARLLQHVRKPTIHTAEDLAQMLHPFVPPGGIEHRWEFFADGVMSWCRKGYHQPKATQGHWLVAGTVGGTTYRGTAYIPGVKGVGETARRPNEIAIQDRALGSVDVLDLRPFGAPSHSVIWDADGWRIEPA